jgi:hypothetical protein
LNKKVLASASAATDFPAPGALNLPQMSFELRSGCDDRPRKHHPA